MDLRLRQKDVAGRLGVSTDTVRNWEAGRTEPAVKHLPRIIDFLATFTLPEGESAADFPAQLTLARRQFGLTQWELATQLGVDESTVWGWENGNHRPTRRRRDRIEALLEAVSSQMPDIGPQPSDP